MNHVALSVFAAPQLAKELAAAVQARTSVTSLKDEVRILVEVARDVGYVDGPRVRQAMSAYRAMCEAASLQVVKLLILNVVRPLRDAHSPIMVVANRRTTDSVAWKGVSVEDAFWAPWNTAWTGDEELHPSQRFFLREIVKNLVDRDAVRMRVWGLLLPDAHAVPQLRELTVSLPGSSTSEDVEAVRAWLRAWHTSASRCLTDFALFIPRVEPCRWLSTPTASLMQPSLPLATVVMATIGHGSFQLFSSWHQKKDRTGSRLAPAVMAYGFGRGAVHSLGKVTCHRWYVVRSGSTEPPTDSSLLAMVTLKGSSDYQLRHQDFVFRLHPSLLVAMFEDSVVRLSPRFGQLASRRALRRVASGLASVPHWQSSTLTRCFQAPAAAEMALCAGFFTRTGIPLPKEVLWAIYHPLVIAELRGCSN